MKDGTYAWIIIHESRDPEIGQFYSGRWYTCGDEQGWPEALVTVLKPIRKVRS